MRDLDNTTTKAKRQRLTVVVAVEPELPEVEVEELERDICDLLFAMAVKARRERDGLHIEDQTT